MTKTVLAIDDSASIRQMVSFTLKSAGYEVLDAVDGQDGLDKAKSNNISLVLTDQNMPRMDGLTLIRTLRALPQYKGKFDGVAVRAPVPVGSIADIVFLTERNTSVEEVNNILREEAEGAQYRGILGVSDDPLVSSDIIKESRASIIDLALTQVVDGNLVKVMAWYDNEWGYTNQMIREAVKLGGG